MNNNIKEDYSNLILLKDKLDNSFEISRKNLDLLIEKYDSPKPTKHGDYIYGKLCLIYCKLDDYEEQLEGIYSRFDELFNYIEYDENISKNGIRKLKTSIKIISSWIDKVNNNYNKLEKICIQENINHLDYLPEIFLDFNKLKNKYTYIINDIINEYEKEVI